MPREVTIKVGYELGSTKGLDQGAKHADGMAANIKEAGKAAAGSMEDGLSKLAKEQADEKSKKSIGGSIKKTLDNVAGGFGLFKWIAAAGAAAAAIGKVSADSHMLAGGAMLRGQGISGMVTGAYDFMSGRSTKEGLQDLKLGQQEFYINQIGQRMERAFERSSALRSVQFKPITEVDPLKRYAASLTRVESLKQQTGIDFQQSLHKFGVEADQLSRQRFMDMKAGNFVDEVGELNMRAASLQSEIKYQGTLGDLEKQRLDLVTQQVQTKRGELRGGALAFGAKTPMEQEFVKRAGRRLEMGEQLAPEEIGALSSDPAAQDMLNKMLMKRAMAGGYREHVGTVGDTLSARTAQEDIRIGGDIGVSFERVAGLERVQKAVQAVEKETQNRLDDLQRKLQETQVILNNRVTVDRKLQIPGGR